MLGSIGGAEQGPRITHHLYHPTSGGYSDFKDLFQRPDYRRNFAILTLIKSYQTPEAFSRRFPAPAHFTAPWVGTMRFACARDAEAIGQVLQELYGEAVSLCSADAKADATLVPAFDDDTWDAALAAICETSLAGRV
jgi:hypothetical protein